MSDTAIPLDCGRDPMPSLERGTVADAMHPGVLSCEADATLADVARIMVTRHVHCVAVMGISDKHPGEKVVWGVIYDLDVVRASVRDAEETTAGALALQPIVTVEPRTLLPDAAELMLTHHVTHLVVVDPKSQRPVGILSSLDLAAVVASAKV
jgi:CBS domain-containing protein